MSLKVLQYSTHTVGSEAGLDLLVGHSVRAACSPNRGGRLPLGVRGAWLKARSSPAQAFGTGVAVIAASSDLLCESGLGVKGGLNVKSVSLSIARRFRPCVTNLSFNVDALVWQDTIAHDRCQALQSLRLMV
jgi:hypothetical protein